MRRKLLLSGMVLFVLLCLPLLPSVEAASMWSRTYGRGVNWACSMVATPDSGYAIVGGDGYDIRLVKIDAFGDLKWDSTYGGGGGDWASSLVATPDGGYAIAGTWNNTGAEMGLEAFGTVYDGDFWFVKTDENGIIPEYSSLLVPALVLTATAFIIINKKRLIRTR